MEITTRRSNRGAERQLVLEGTVAITVVAIVFIVLAVLALLSRLLA